MNALGELFAGIAAAIREKTGESEKMKPIDFPAKIAAIETGGGSSPDVRYVTFMSQDGTIEYGKKAVAVGDDCADPISRGVFSEPTKENTAQYYYTFNGWSAIVGGDADPSALAAVNEDRTVYAGFKATVRTYTVTYYDGSYTLGSAILAYGEIPVIDNPKKSGHSFTGWEPALGPVTGDIAYYAQWEETITFSGGSWADIARIAESGQAAEVFSIGDERTEVVDGKNVVYRIIGFNHDDLSDGSGKAGITIKAYKAPAIVTALDTENSGLASRVYWEMSTARKYCNETIFQSLPADLQAVIKTVDKVSDGGYNNATLYTTQDKIWIPSLEEVVDATNYLDALTEGQGTRYADTAARLSYTETGSQLSSVLTRSIKYTGETNSGPGKVYVLINKSPYVAEMTAGGRKGTVISYIVYCFCV